MKSFGFFIIGIFTGLTISVLMKDSKPVSPIIIHDTYRLGYRYPPFYPYGYDYYFRPLEYRGGGHSRSNTKTDEGRRGGKDTERGENHGRTIEVNDRKKN